jgi:hypothetical protein
VRARTAAVVLASFYSFAAEGKVPAGEHRTRRLTLWAIDTAAEEENLEVTVAEVEKVLADFGRTWEGLSGDERREVLRSLVEYLKVYPDHAELKLLFRPEVRLGLDLRRAARP